MIWLQRPPMIRWLLTAIIALGALWVEFGAGTSTEHPFARVAINVGDAIVDANTEMRTIPDGLLEHVDAVGFATRPFSPGEPLTPTGIDTRSPLPQSDNGWWALMVEIPASASIGDGVQMVLLDSGTVVPGVVDSLANDDPLSTGTGTVAIPSEYAVEAAQAAANGRLVVLVQSG